MQDAQTMMVATLRWRDEFDVEAAMKEEFPEDVFGKLGRNFGHDKEGRPVSYVLSFNIGVAPFDTANL